MEQADVDRDVIPVCDDLVKSVAAGEPIGSGAGANLKDVVAAAAVQIIVARGCTSA